MKQNYNKMYDKKNATDVEEKVVTEEPVVEEIKEEPKPEKKERVQKLPFMVEIIGNLNLNVRKTPNGEIVTSIPDGAQARVMEISEDGNWYFIESPKGYIKKEFTKKVK